METSLRARSRGGRKSGIFLIAGAIIPVLLLLAQASAPHFIDIAAKSGLTISNTFGGKEKRTSFSKAPARGRLSSTTTGTGPTTFSSRMEPRSTPTPRPLARNSTTTMARVFYRSGSTGRADAVRLGASRLCRRFRQRRASGPSGHLLRPQ